MLSIPNDELWREIGPILQLLYATTIRQTRANTALLMWVAGEGGLIEIRQGYALTAQGKRILHQRIERLWPEWKISTEQTAARGLRVGDRKAHLRALQHDGSLVPVDPSAKIQAVHSRLSVRPTAVEHMSAIPLNKGGQVAFDQKIPAAPEWYVSYAWGDGTPEGKAREEIVNQLCNAARMQGRRILRDKDTLRLGDSISAFMQRMGRAARIFVILSDKYLRSPHCMFELSEIWRNSQQDKATFLDRVRAYSLPETAIWSAFDRTAWSIYWKKEYNNLYATAQECGLAPLGESGIATLRLMERFSREVADILATLTDTVQPRTFKELERYGFDDNSPIH